MFPVIHILALSLSSSNAASTGKVFLWPSEFTFSAYKYIMKRMDFWISFVVSIKRVILGLAVNMAITVITAYPLSKNSSAFRSRSVYVWYFFITTLIGGGLVPTYMLIKQLGMIDSIWSLVLPGAVPVFNIILMLNFFRQLPKELEEAAFIDGAGHWTILWKIYIPTSAPSIATIALFCIVGHWNSWFDGIIYMNHPENYPLQSYLRSVVVTRDIDALSSITNQVGAAEMKAVSEKTSKAAQIFIGALPIIAVYPFLQKYFTKGIVLGSVKG
jgi:putative aldouronate transport system permease protein